MKTTNAGGTVIDEPKSREAVKPAVDKSTAAKRAPKPSQIYVDGKFYAEGEAKVSVFDHGLLYGDGIFEGIRFYNGRVFRLEEHLERLWDSARSICLEIPMSQRAMTEALLETIRQNDLREGYIRLLVTRGVGNLGLNPEQCKTPSVIIITAQVALYPETVYRNGLSVVTCATRRTNPSALNPADKSRNYSFGRFRNRGRGRNQGERNRHYTSRRFHCGRMFSHRHGGGDYSGGQSGRPADRHRQTRPDYCANGCALPGNDARDRNADLLVRSTSARKVLDKLAA